MLSRLGHASALEPLNTYSPLWPDSEDRTRTAVDAALRDSRDHRGTSEGPRGLGPLQSACGGESACTPDSVEGGHPSRPTVTRRFQRSTRELGGPPAPCLTLLHVGFTEPPGSPRALVRSYRTVAPLPVRTGRSRSAIGGLFSVALSCGSPRLGVTQHVALWSPDVPRTGRSPYATTRPAHHRAGIIPRRERRRSRCPRGAVGRRASRRSRRRRRRRRAGRGPRPR